MEPTVNIPGNYVTVPMTSETFSIPAALQQARPAWAAADVAPHSFTCAVTTISDRRVEGQYVYDVRVDILPL